MIQQKSFRIIWDRTALNEFKNILDYLSNQSSQAPVIVRKGVFSRLRDIERNPFIFEVDKLKVPLD